MESKNFYKFNRIPSLAESLAKRSQNIIAERQEKRREFFWGSRIVSDEVPPAENNLEKKKRTRAEMLKKWKAEKLKKLEEEKNKKKPIFKVGILQRKATGSPILTQQKTYLKKTTQQTDKKYSKNNAEIHKSGVLTRAKAKTMGVKPDIKPIMKPQINKFCRIEGGIKKQIDSHVFKVPETVSKLSCKPLTQPYSPKLSKGNEKLIKHQVDEKKEIVQQENHIQNELKVVNSEPQLVLPEKTTNEEDKNENHAEEKVAEESQPKEVEQPQVSPEKTVIETDNYRPIVYSPFVTVRSGKKSQRKSRKTLSIDVDEKVRLEEEKVKCRIFSFRKFIEDEKKRLLEMCDQWKHIYEEFQEIPGDVEGDIDSVIGKTNLLTSDKFMQFKGLIDKCENGDPFVKIDDLQGFQDWVSIEVERIDEEFHKLEKRKCNGWKCETVFKDVTKVQKPKVVKKSTKKPVGSSNIRSHISAIRKLLKEKNGQPEEGFPSEKLFNFEQGPKTPLQKENLLKDVLNSEAKRRSKSFSKKSPVVKEKRNSGLEIMIATQKNKFPTPIKLQKSPVLADFEIIIQKEETPNRSILKKTPKTGTSSKGHVTFKKTNRNFLNAGRGLSEKYFQPLTDDDSSPMRTILGDVGNLTPGRMQTRSWTRKMSQSGLLSPIEN